jgi:diguanylate cyclase (GGDEF)-like protein/PAS domain S-box-containing protein
MSSDPKSRADVANHLDDRVVSWHRLLDVLPDGVALVDECGIIRHVNELLMKMTGYARDELVGQAVEVLVPSRYRGEHVGHRDDFSRKSSVRQIGTNANLALVRHDGSELAIDAALVPMQFDEKPWVVASIRDATERRATERARHIAEQLVEVAKAEAAEALATSEQRFRNAFELNMAPMIFTDLEDRVTAANEAFCQLLGRTKEELLGNDMTSFTYPEDLGISEASRELALKGETDRSRYVKRFLHKDGRVIVGEISRSLARDAAGTLLYFVISGRDITDRIKKDHMLRLLSEVNRIAMLAIDEVQFLQQLCDILVDVGGYALAWIATNSQNGTDGVDVFCAAGATDYLHGEMDSWWGSKESRLGQAGNALRTQATTVVNNREINAITEPWRQRSSQFGFGSSVAIPGRVGSQHAALVIYGRDFDTFDEMTVKGLEEIVREAGFAITHVRSVRKTKVALEETTVAVTAMTSAEHALTESEQRFRLAFEDNMAPMSFSDLDDVAIAVNDAFCEMVGFTREELIGHDSTQFTYPEDVGITERAHPQLTSNEVGQVRYIKRYLRKDGRVIVSEISRSAARDASGKTLYFVSSERDITEERVLSDQLSHLALHDPLTGLANRTLFEDRLIHAHARASRHGEMGAVLLLDLDDFKGVNDTHGHLVGDELLVGIARRLELVTRSSDTLCRLGGDEFLYLAEGLTSTTEAEEVAKRLLAVLAEPFSFSGFHLEQHASIGVVVWDGATADSNEFVRNADVALYEAKRQRRGGYALFTPSMHQQAINRFAIVQELHHALQVGELSMHFQPIVNLTTTEVVGFEALMRWQHPERGWVPPDTFIPLAENSSLILDLGYFALRESVTAAISWGQLSDQARSPYVTVNLSAHQFRDPGLVPMIEEILRASGLAPERLILEITESVALLDVLETLSVIDHLKRLGITVALDDFGTGFSSLSYLVLLNPKIIKIDRYFVNPPNDSAHSETLLETIVSLGDKLQMKMLAEGIETQPQLDLLRDLKCELGQGYLFSPAVPADQAKTMVGRVFGNKESIIGEQIQGVSASPTCERHPPSERSVKVLATP